MPPRVRLGRAHGRSNTPRHEIQAGADLSPGATPLNKGAGNSPRSMNSARGSIYSAISALKDRAILLARRDGAILFRFPELPYGAPDRVTADASWNGRIAAGGGVFQSPGLDRKPRLIVVHPVDGYPLVVAVSETNEAILAPWRMRALQIGFGASWRSCAPSSC